MTISDLVNKCSIVDYISQYVELREKRGEFWGLSPFKHERTPSFSANEEKKVFYDYSSGKSGNIISFIMYYHNCNFRSALKILKDYCGVTDEIIDLKSETFMSMRKFRPDNKVESDFQRKILPADYMNRFSKRRIKLWEEEGVLPEIIEKYNVRYDAVADAIVFPIYDNYGNLINVKGRRVSPEIKRLGLPKYFHYFKVGRLDYFFGLYDKQSEILESGEVILVEGEKSVMKLEGWGINNAIAIGTSVLNEWQIKTIIPYGVNIIIALDKDKNPCYNKDIQLLRRLCNVYVILDKKNLLGEKDAPVDKGKEVWEELYSGRFIL